MQQHINDKLEREFHAVPRLKVIQADYIRESYLRDDMNVHAIAKELGADPSFILETLRDQDSESDDLTHLLSSVLSSMEHSEDVGFFMETLTKTIRRGVQDATF